jgi:hypothetical protein
VRAAHLAGRALRPAARLTGAARRAATRRVVRPIGKAARTGAQKTGRRIARTRPVVAARNARRTLSTLPGRAVARWATRRHQPGHGTRQISPARRRAYAIASYIAANAWQRFLRGTGLARSSAWQKANDIVRNSWEDFLHGTGLADLDKGVGDPFGPNAKPLHTHTGPAPHDSGRTPVDASVGAPPPPSGPHTSAAGGAAATSRTGGTTVVHFAKGDVNVLPPILAGAEEAFVQACAQFHCVNANGKPAAGAARQFMRELARLIEAMGTAVNQVGQKCLEEIYTLPASAELLQQMGTYLTLPAQEIADAADTYDRVHDQDVDRWLQDDDKLNSLDRQDNRPI